MEEIIAEELRIGNFVKSPTIGVVKVTKIEHGMIKAENEEGKVCLSNALPVKLTPEVIKMINGFFPEESNQIDYIEKEPIQKESDKKTWQWCTLVSGMPSPNKRFHYKPSKTKFRMIHDNGQIMFDSQWKKDNYPGIISIVGDGYESEWTATPVKYLHQLQNLYFILTGEELEVNYGRDKSEQ